MGIYLNPGPMAFRMAKQSPIYVDKSGLIAVTNSLVQTQQRFVCVSRPRRFGKTMAMDMLAAYYQCGEDTHTLFEGCEIDKDRTFEKYINHFCVIKLNMQSFLSSTDSIGNMIGRITRFITAEILNQYPDVFCLDPDDFEQVMRDTYAHTGRAFVILIDEWDCIFRDYRENTEAQTKYLDFLRMWLKDQDYVALAYMTGILPIKKYGTHSALNMFEEYGMTNPRRMAPFFGFTRDEVRKLCSEHDMSYEEASAWYDGYELSGQGPDGDKVYAMYNPRSVVEAMLSHSYDNYWNQTETYEALKKYILMNMDGLKDAVVRMLSGDSERINTGTFVNDMVTFATRDDVLTLLVHLGYLSYHRDTQTVSIPNKEVSQEYVNAISTMDWHEVYRSVEASRALLQSLWAMDGDAVAAGIDRAHDEIPILRYNDENALSCTVNLAFYFAREYYTIIRELPSGRGYADICFIPRQLYADKPAAIIELKWDKSAQGAIAQIKEKQYVNALKDYHGRLLLAGINYDRETKKHACVIEKTDM